MLILLAPKFGQQMVRPYQYVYSWQLMNSQIFIRYPKSPGSSWTSLRHAQCMLVSKLSQAIVRNPYVTNFLEIKL